MNFITQYAKITNKYPPINKYKMRVSYLFLMAFMINRTIIINPINKTTRLPLISLLREEFLTVSSALFNRTKNFPTAYSVYLFSVIEEL